MKKYYLCSEVMDLLLCLNELINECFKIFSALIFDMVNIIAIIYINKLFWGKTIKASWDQRDLRIDLSTRQSGKWPFYSTSEVQRAKSSFKHLRLFKLKKKKNFHAALSGYHKRTNSPEVRESGKMRKITWILAVSLAISLPHLQNELSE